MSERGKLTYAELLRERNALQKKVDALNRCMEQANRKKVYYHVFDWVAIPIHPVQYDAVVAAIRPLVRHDASQNKNVFGTQPNVKTWETMAEDPHYTILPNFNAYLIHYDVEEGQSEPVNLKVWGLTPV